MADIQPLRALHYDPAVAGALADVVAPPYDVIDAAQYAALLARSPFNIVAVDMPLGGLDGGDAPHVEHDAEHGPAGPDGGDTRSDPHGDAPDPYETAARRLDGWLERGALARDAEPALWAHTQTYTGPDGIERTRRGFFCRVRIEDYGPGKVRPHERTHPGPIEDRLALTRATRTNVSPIFSLFSDPEQHAWRALSEVIAGHAPWGEVTDADGTVHRVWRVTDAHAIAAAQAATQGRELLIADGHHRYETMREYAREMRGTGETTSPAAYDYVLMCLVALEDPGLTVFPTHRLVRGLDERRRAALWQTLERDFDVVEVPVERIAPPPGKGPLEIGFIEGRDGRALRATLKDQAIADAALADRSPAYRQLDTGVLETLLLKGALELSDEDIAHFNGMFYARDSDEALRMVRSGDYDAAFLLRATPVEQVRDVASAGESMPPKSTYFFPKLLTGLVLNPLY